MALDQDIQKQITKLRNLPQYQGKSDDFLSKVAYANILRKNFDVGSRFVNTEEVKKAQQLFSDYCDVMVRKYNIDDLDVLHKISDIVYLVILKSRLETNLNKSERPNGTFLIGDKEVKSILDLQKRIDEMWKELGLDHANPENTQKNSPLDVLEKTKKKLLTYYKENIGEFTCTCSRCGKMLFFWRRVKDYDNKPHPWFKGRYLYNQAIIDDVIAGELTKEKAAKYLDTSEQYIQYCIDNQKLILDADKD